MTVEFNNSEEKTTVIATIVDDQDMNENDRFSMAYKSIKQFCDEHDFTVYYHRIWNDPTNSFTIVDVGSHTEFFFVRPSINFELLKSGE